MTQSNQEFPFTIILIVSSVISIAASISAIQRALMLQRMKKHPIHITFILLFVFEIMQSISNLFGSHRYNANSSGVACRASNYIFQIGWMYKALMSVFNILSFYYMFTGSSRQGYSVQLLNPFQKI